MEKSEIDRKKKDKKADLVRYRPPGRRGSGGDVLTDSGRLTNSDGKSTDFSFGSDPTEPRGNRIKGAEKIKSKVFEKRNVSEDFADVEQKQNIVEAKKPNVQEDINLRHASEEKSQIGMKKVSERRQPYGGPRVQQQRGAGVDKIRNEEIPLSFPNEPKDVRSQQGERRHSQQQRPHQAVDRGQQRHQPNYDRREPMHSRGSSFTMSDVRLDQSHLVDPVQVRQEHSNGPGDLRTHQGGQKLKRKSNRPKRAGPGELNFHRGKPSEQQQQPIAVRDTSKNQLEDIDLDIPRCFVSSRTKDMPQKVNNE